MSVPAMPGSGDPDSRWETIRYAVDSTPRTFRLCLIVLALGLSGGLGTAIAVLATAH
jgi:hypothetical protein